MFLELCIYYKLNLMNKSIKIFITIVLFANEQMGISHNNDNDSVNIEGLCKVVIWAL